MDFRPTEQQQVLRRAVREFAETEILPFVREWDEAQAFPRVLVGKMAALGLMGIQFPEEYGGAAMSAIDYCICIEELARVDPAVSLSVAAHNGLCASHIAMFGTEAQKRRYLVSLATGAAIGAWGLTEPTAGSDAARIRTAAARDGDGWVINGTKTFITHGSIGDLMVVMAVTDKARAHRGISAFIVERGNPGMAAGRKEDKLGMRASDTSEVIFRDCRVPADALLGAEHEGFINTLQVLDAGRIGIAALAVGLAQGAYETARRYALERTQFGQPIIRFQAVSHKIADMHIHYRAATSLVYEAAQAVDGGERARNAAAAAKVLASETATRTALDAVQILGGYGYIREFPVERLARDAKLLEIGGGTSEILRNLIVSELGGNPRAR
jgi:hypothetical protein